MTKKYCLKINNKPISEYSSYKEAREKAQKTSEITNKQIAIFNNKTKKTIAIAIWGHIYKQLRG